MKDGELEHCEFEDPHGHLARWLGQGNKRGTVHCTVSGSAIDKARFREQIEALAEQGPAVLLAVEPKFRAVFGK